MAVLKNPKHERFCQEIAKGKSQTVAYEIAFNTNGSGAAVSATRLLKKANIQSRVAELQQRTAEKAAVTADSLMVEADMIMRAAIAAEQFSAAVSALKEKGVLSGKRVEKTEHGEPGEFDAITDADELRRVLVERAQELGAGAFSAAITGGEGAAGPSRRSH